MTEHSTLALRVLGWALLAGGLVGFVAYTSEQPALGIASALGGVVCWAAFTTAAGFVEHVSTRLTRIEAHAKRAADALEQVTR